jgi:carboxypeptidase PM20D1
MDFGTILVSILIGLGVLVLFLAAFIAMKTMFYSPRQKKVKPREFVDIDGKSVAERLGLAVQFKTISLANSEEIDENAFLGLHRMLQTLYPQLHTKLKREVVNDFSLLYTWEGKNPELKPILLAAHLDVVPADEGEDSGWSHPPFSGELADGSVWGRGTLDDKNSVIGICEAVEYLLKQGYQPERTIYLGFGHDEEIGGVHGATEIAALLESRGVQLGCLLDEGGSVIESFLPGVDTPAAMIGISEKGYLSLKLTVEVDGGHSSMPAQETAIGILSLAIAKLELNPMPARLEVIEFMMSYLGSALPFFQRMLFANTWLFGGILKKELGKSNLLNASIRTTTAPTIINAGNKDNVLPGKAEAVVNFRILPGDDLRSVYEMVLERIDDERVKVTPYQGDTLADAGWDPSPVADVDSVYFLLLARLASEAFPGAMTAPYLVLGGTDARRYANVTRNAFRFMPVLMSKADLGTMHGINEKLSFEECARMVGFYIAYIQQMADLPAEADIEDAVEEEEPEEELFEELDEEPEDELLNDLMDEDPEPVPDELKKLLEKDHDSPAE